MFFEGIYTERETLETVFSGDPGVAVESNFGREGEELRGKFKSKSVFDSFISRVDFGDGLGAHVADSGFGAVFGCDVDAHPGVRYFVGASGAGVDLSATSEFLSCEQAHHDEPERGDGDRD